MPPAVLLLFFLLVPGSTSQPAPLRRLETTFTFVSTTINRSECPSPISHTRVRLYNGLGEVPQTAVLWEHLRVSGGPCLSSDNNLTVTIFFERSPSPPDTPSSQANPFFAVGRDNSPRSCRNFNASRQASYFFTDDMPRFKQRFIDDNLFPAGSLPQELEDPKRGDIYMFSQQFAGAGVTSNTVCIYIAERPEPTSTPEDRNEEEDDGGSVCFPGDVEVELWGGGRKTVRDVRVGDVIRTGKGSFSPVVSFSHWDENEVAWFVSLELRVGNLSRVFKATRGHYIYTTQGVKMTGEVKTGDWVRVVEGTGQVVGVETWRGRGVYSPVTMDGKMVVQGVEASVYTNSVNVRTAHAALAVVRGGFWIGFGDWCWVMDLLRWAFR